MALLCAYHTSNFSIISSFEIATNNGGTVPLKVERSRQIHKPVLIPKFNGTVNLYAYTNGYKLGTSMSAILIRGFVSEIGRPFHRAR